MRTLALCAIIFASFEASAAGGPTNIGSIGIGMSKAEYVSALGITTIDCTKLKKGEDKVFRSEIKSLAPGNKKLCYDLRMEKNNSGIADNIQVGDISYDIIEASGDASKLIKTIGHSSTAIFLKDRLISLEIYEPKASLETLTTKYGSPTFVDNTNIEICKNRIGNEFKNKVGSTDAVWTNGEVSAMLRIDKRPPQKTCSDVHDMLYYILEEGKQVKLIESAISSFRKDIGKEAAKDSLF